MNIPVRGLGAPGLKVSALGLGCMGMSENYGPVDGAEAVRTIRAALDAGVTLLDTADQYGQGANEELVGRAVAGRRDQVVLATKFGLTRDPRDPSRRGVDGRPEYVRACIEASLRRLGVDHVDLYYQHRVDPRGYLAENLAAAEITLTPEEVASLDGAAPVGAAAGERYPSASL
ncbi:aldo/keto reductase [Actinomadura xylanilytica]|uniref:aldo/keto reductase n=1 Tax=Actinomadura xylanilytica TaxID=887459 RepID=UPI00255AFF59|nr:aldo/keto reductase [Actinomadura xylanilytica]MDL4771821.1 aldo/keto reductase [Actinomadura xylanilytica]